MRAPTFLLLSTLLAVPIATLAAPWEAPTPDPAAQQVCADVPLVVDECGDTMGSLSTTGLSANSVSTNSLSTSGLSASSGTVTTLTATTLRAATLTTTSTIAAAGAVTAASYQYAAPKTGQVFQDPATCVRASFAVNPTQYLWVTHPPASTAGPAVGIDTAGPDGLYNLYCPVSLPFPPGGSVTITGGALGFVDERTTCLVGATIRMKTQFTTSSGTALITTVYDGAGATDYNAQFTGAQSKAFTANDVVDSGKIVWVQAILDGTTGGNCRYLGMRLDYTVTQA